MNLQAYAAHRKANGLRGTSHVAVLKAIQTGRLTAPAVKKTDGRWNIDPVLADEQWGENTTTTKLGSAELERSQPRGSAKQSKVPTRAQADAVRVTYQAKLLELKFKEQQGELVSRAAERKRWFEAGRKLRDDLRRLPLLIVGDISQIVGGLTTEQRAEMLIFLERQVVTVLEEVSKGGT